jgi:predicted aspartyl protease
MRQRRKDVWTSTAWHVRARRTRTGLMTVPVVLFQLPYVFLVDSGAAYSIIDQHIAEEHELPLLQAVPWMAPGSERTQSPRARVPLSVGGRDGIEVVTNALVVALPDAFNVDGFLGADVLRQFDVTLEAKLMVLRQRVHIS